MRKTNLQLVYEAPHLVAEDNAVLIHHLRTDMSFATNETGRAMMASRHELLMAGRPGSD